MRVIYAVPSDKEHDPDIEGGTGLAMLSLQLWFKNENGETFALIPEPLLCRLPQPEAYFTALGERQWERFYRARDSLVENCGDFLGETEYATAVFLDVDEQCSPDAEFRGAVLPTQQQAGYFILGAIHLFAFGGGLGCQQDATFHTGVVGHELGHILGLHHPADCVAGKETCDLHALMWWGGILGLWPDSTYLLDDDREILDASDFVRTP